jgi:predicted nucleic acid-binding protein
MYVDSAYVAKFYLNEPDSSNVRAVLATASELVSSVWALGEVACALHRNLREGMLNQLEYRTLLKTFLDHVDDGVWTLVPVTDRLLRRMVRTLDSLPAVVQLRTGDALHLATASELAESEIWSSDRHVLAAAKYFGLVGRSA